MKLSMKQRPRVEAAETPEARKAILDERRLELLIHAYFVTVQHAQCLAILEGVEVFCECPFGQYQRLHACFEGMGGSIHTLSTFNQKPGTTDSIRLIDPIGVGQPVEDDGNMRMMTILALMEEVNRRYDYALAEEHK